MFPSEAHLFLQPTCCREVSISALVGTGKSEIFFPASEQADPSQVASQDCHGLTTGTSKVRRWVCHMAAPGVSKA